MGEGSAGVVWFAALGFRLISIDDAELDVAVKIETDAERVGCRSCGSAYTGRGRRGVHRLDLRQVAVTPRLPPVGELAERVDDTTQPIPCLVDRQRRGVDPSKLYVNTDSLIGDGLDDLGRTTARLLERNSDQVGMLREYAYNAQTGAIDRIVGRWENTTSGFQDATYTRDAVGNVTTITDNVTATATRECFLYDSRNRLVRAHTAAPGVACLDSDTAAPLASGSRGVDAYDTRWIFDSINRIDKRIDMLPGGAGTLDHQYGDGGHPHAVTGMTDAANQPLADYDYDYNAVGAMTGRRSNAEAEDTLIYDPEQRLTSYNRASGDDETYQYWASNQRVVRQAGTTRTITLPGLDITIQGTTRTITKQITAAGASVATKTITTSTSTVYWNCADLQNSATCQAEAGTHTTSPTIRRYQPYGTPRNTNTLPNNTRGYLNQPEDPTGLNYLNNRYHDPTLGAFTTVDPLVGKTGQPYLYGNGNPTTLSDPGGLAACSDEDNCGFAGSGTGKTSQLTDKQLDALEADGGAALISETAVETAGRYCKSNWRQCHAYVARPADYWNLDDPYDAAMYEAYRLVYRHLLAQVRGGAASISAGYFGQSGGRVVLGDDSAHITIVSAGWTRSGSVVSSSWTKHEEIGWDDLKIAVAITVWGICTMATEGAGAATCTAGTGAMFVAGEVESLVDRGIMPGGAKADWGGFFKDLTVNSIATIVGISAGGGFIQESGELVSHLGISVGLARALNGLANAPALIVTVGNP